MTAASSVIGIELVLEASIAPSPSASSICLKMLNLRSTFSVAASISQIGVDRGRRRHDPLDRGRRHVTLDLAFLHQLGQRLLDRPTGPHELRVGHVHQSHVEAGDGGHLGDPRPHLAGTDDADPLGHGAGTSSTIASPWAAPEQIAASPIPPPRRRSS